MTNCIKNCFRSENRGHRSGGRGFYLLLYGFTSSELVGRCSVHELRAGGSLPGSRAHISGVNILAAEPAEESFLCMYF